MVQGIQNYNNICVLCKMAKQLNSDAAFWLCESYRPCTYEERQRPMRLLDILMLYEDHCAKQQTVPQSKEHIHRLIPKLFPDSKHAWVCMNKKKYTSYTNMCRVEVTHNDVLKITDEAVSVSKDENGHLLIDVPTMHAVNGKNAVLTLLFDNDGLSITMNDRKLKNYLLDVPVHVKDNQTSIDALLRVMKSIRICKGMNMQSSGERKRSNSVVEEWNNICSTEKEARARSPKCSSVLTWHTRTEMCGACHSHFITPTPSPTEVVNGDSADGDAANKKNDEQCTGHSNTSLTTDKNNEQSTDYGNSTITAKTDNSLLKMLECVLERGASDEFQILLRSQLTNMDSNKDPRYRRWDKDVIRVCLTLYCRSPQAYADLKLSGMLVLPTERLLRYYKNAVRQRPGINSDQLEWMESEAELANLTEYGRHGGLLLDEMTIQDDLQITKEGDAWKLAGMVDMGSVCNNIDTIKNNGKTVKMATHILQLVFHGLTGFRWPVAYFASTSATAHQVYLNVWDCVDQLDDHGFTTDYIMMDGGSANRSFTNMLFNGSPREQKYTTSDIFNVSHKIAIIQDAKHCLKKICNGIESSRISNVNASGRHLVNAGQSIVWDHFEEVANFNWQFGFRIHRKLTREHIELTPVSKMRNELATSVLNRDMLFLMRSYQQSSTCRNPARLNSTVELLKHTSVLVDVFDDVNRPIKRGDPRLSELSSVLTYFNNWETHVKSTITLCETKHLLSKECRDDLNSCILGVLSLCDTVLLDGATLTPGYLNSDLIENFFCQQRGIHHGCNTNPTVQQYGPAVNAICLGQTTVSNKANSGASGTCFVGSKKTKLSTK